MAVYVLAVFMTVMDGTMVNVALPTLADEFGVASTDIEWVAVGYLLSLAAVIPVAGWLGDRVSLESERGYHVTLPAAEVGLRRMLIMAEDQFVMTPMSVGLRLAGTVEMGGLEAEPNMVRAKVLLKKARRVLPSLADAARVEGKTEWAGHRPATPDTIPVISASPRVGNVFYGFGHGHLGLTQAAVTGRLLADLVDGKSEKAMIQPFRVNRF